MNLDIKTYLPYLDQYDWSREEKIEILHAIWRLTEAQADKAFGLNSVRLSCGQNKNIASHYSTDTVDSKDKNNIHASIKTANDDVAQAKGVQHVAR